MNITVRPEEAADTKRTFAVVESAFESRVEADLVDALRRSARPQISLVAEVDGELVGHIFFSPVAIETDGPVPPAGQLAPVAVAPRCQRRGVGSALVRAGLERCRAIGWRAVFLVGDPAYYSRFGFRLAGPLGFSYREEHDPYLQVLELDPGALSGVRGRLRLDQAFAEVGAE